MKLIGGMIFIGGFMILLAQFVYWLKAGIWIPVDLWWIWTEVGAGQISLPTWRRVGKILYLILHNLPASLSLMIAGLLLHGASSLWGNARVR
jgi:hypothetical protein